MDNVSEPMHSAAVVQDKLRSGLVWYAAVLPGIGLFLERFTLNKYLGLLLWGLIIIIRPFCCLADMRILEKRGVMSCSRWFALVPTVYYFKRCMRLRHNMAIAVVSMICFGYAVVGNGFTGGLMIDDQRIMNAVRNESIKSVTELKNEKISGSIADAAESALDNAQWSIVSDGDVRTVTVIGTSKSGNDSVSLIFKVTHDGYTFTGFDLEKVMKNGSEIKDEEREEYLKKLFSAESDG